MLASKRGVYLPELVMVPKRQPGVQMHLNKSELPDEIKTMVKEDTVKKKMYNKKTANIPANYILEIHDLNDRDFTRYGNLYCSQYYFKFFTSFIYSEKKSNTVCWLNHFSNVRNNSSSRGIWRNNKNRVVYNKTNSEKVLDFL